MSALGALSRKYGRSKIIILMKSGKYNDDDYVDFFMKFEARLCKF